MTRTLRVRTFITCSCVVLLAATARAQSERNIKKAAEKLFKKYPSALL
jgi:hypothetical protein